MDGVTLQRLRERVVVWRARAGDGYVGELSANELLSDVVALLRHVDDLQRQVDAASAILAEAEKFLPGTIQTAGRFAIGVSRDKLEAAEAQVGELTQALRDVQRYLEGGRSGFKAIAQQRVMEALAAAGRVTPHEEAT